MSELGRQGNDKRSEPVYAEREDGTAEIFAPKETAAAGRMPVSNWIIAGLVILVAVVVLVFA
ncbi:MAG TPA: hypothetical protein VIX90_16835, partial [Edaphobacter sp.]